MKRTWIPAISAALALLAAACGSPASPAAQAPAAEPQARATNERPADQCEPGKEHWRENGAPKRGGTLIRSTNEIEHFDILQGGRHGLAAIPQVYNGLLENRGCFYGDTQVIPALARSWEVSPDGLTWTFRLRDDVKWHNKPPVNGRAFTSADVAWTIDAQLAGGLMKSYWTGVTHQEPDARTIVLRMPQPDADFLGKVGFHHNLIYAREVKEQHGDFKSVAIGTGAFMLKESRPNQDVVIERRPDHHLMGADGKPLPYLDEVKTVIFNDQVAEVAAMRAGQLDHTGSFGLRHLDAIAMKQANPKMRMNKQFVLSHQVLWINPAKKPFDDPRVRKAMQLTVDREDIIASLGGPDAAAHSSFVPRFLDSVTWPEDKAKEKFRVDRDQAKRLLAEAGYSPGATFLMRTAGQYQQEAEAVQQHLSAIGIATRLDIDATTFSSTLQKGDFDLAWGAYSGGPFPNFWVGDFIKSGSNQNFSKVNDPRVDELVTLHSKELDPAKRKQYIDQLQDRLYEIMPFVPTVTNYYNHFMTCRVRNAKMANPTYNTPLPVEAWLDTTGC